MFRVLEQQLRRTLRKLGFDVTRYRLESSEAFRLDLTLKHFDIELVFDVGANTGQYAESIRRSGYAGRIVSFEPLRAAHARLLENASRDPLWQVHERCAIGNSSGTVDINVAGNSVSSSLRPMLARHLEAAPQSQYLGTETTAIISLDSIFASYRTGGETTFLKIDTQGYEREVLDGAAASLDKIKAIQLELSLVPLYEGQPLWEFFFSKLAAQGYELWSLMPGFSDHRTGQSLQVDAVFCRVG